MDHLVLGIGYQCGEYEATQNEWRQHGIEFDFADDFGQAMQKLSERDYVCVAVCSDCLPHDDIDALRKVRAIPIVVLPAEFNAAQRYECCNYDHGNCIALDDGEECICVQSISYSMLCKWFRSAVLLLPLDKGLGTALLFRDEMKRCVTCGQPFRPGSNRAKYCSVCATQAHRQQKAASGRRRRANRIGTPERGPTVDNLKRKSPDFMGVSNAPPAGGRHKSLFSRRNALLIVHTDLGSPRLASPRLGFQDAAKQTLWTRHLGTFRARQARRELTAKNTSPLRSTLPMWAKSTSRSRLGGTP